MELVKKNTRGTTATIPRATFCGSYYEKKTWYEEIERDGSVRTSWLLEKL